MVVALVGLVPLACKREGGAPPIGSSSPTAVVAPSVGSAPTPTVAAGDQGCRRQARPTKRAMRD